LPDAARAHYFPKCRSLFTAEQPTGWRRIGDNPTGARKTRPGLQTWFGLLASIEGNFWIDAHPVTTAGGRLGMNHSIDAEHIATVLQLLYPESSVLKCFFPREKGAFR
jgi:hypothetical protein